MKLEEEPPIFSKQKVNFSPTDRITHLAVSSELLVLAMANNVLLRIDLRQPDKPQGNDILRLPHSTPNQNEMNRQKYVSFLFPELLHSR
jgi:hypothetical protein